MPAISEIVTFHRVLTDFYYTAGRHGMLWRRPGKNGVFDPYKILVSEMMLQQTQVDRVTGKYVEFIDRFPSVNHLAAAPLSDVLTVWNGLGYNRRAKYIHQAARLIEKEFDAAFPASLEELMRIPGVGPNTAGAIMAYAYNAPVVFVETNVRTVIIHHFFAGKPSIHDAEIRTVMSALVPKNDDSEMLEMQGAALTPREFYWALMDYGTHLKKTVGNVNRASKHYTRQSKFEGSKRQIRGQAIKLLAEKPLSRTELARRIPDERLGDVLAVLEAEGLVKRSGSRYRLS